MGTKMRIFLLASSAFAAPQTRKFELASCLNDCKWYDAECQRDCFDWEKPENELISCLNDCKWYDAKCQQACFGWGTTEKPTTTTNSTMTSSISTTTEGTTTTTSTTTTTTTTTTEETTTTTTASSFCEDGIYPSEEDCSKFYQCANGIKYPDQDCPPGLLFNAELSVCDFPQNANC